MKKQKTQRPSSRNLAKILALTLSMVLFLAAFLASTTGVSATSDMTLHRSGNQLVNASGQTVRLAGVNVPPLCWSVNGDNVALTLVQKAIDTWGANAIRLNVEQYYWNADTAGTGYRALVDSCINYAREKNAYIVLDMHSYTANVTGGVPYSRTNPGSSASGLIQGDKNFWASAAAKYKTAQNVIFGLFNEYDQWTDNANWVWWQSDMQTLINIIRGTGAQNMVCAGGLNWAYDLKKYSSYPLNDPTGNLMFDSHIYPNKTGGRVPTAADWDNILGTIYNSYPLLVGEFGTVGPQGQHDRSYDTMTMQFEIDYMNNLMAYINAHNLSYTAWSFHWGAEPSLLNDTSYNPTAYGQLVKNFIASHNSGTPATTASTAATAAPTTPPATGTGNLIAGLTGVGKKAPGSGGAITGAATDLSISSNASKLTDGNLTNQFDVGYVGAANYFGVAYDLGSSQAISQVKVHHYGSGRGIKGLSVYASNSAFDYTTLYNQTPVAQVSQSDADALSTTVSLTTTARYIIVFLTGNYDTQYDYYRPREIEVFAPQTSTTTTTAAPATPTVLTSGLIGTAKKAPGSGGVITGAASDFSIGTNAAKLTDGNLTTQFDIGYVGASNYFGVTYDLGSIKNISEIKVYHYGQGRGIKGIVAYASTTAFDFATMYSGTPIASATQSDANATLTSASANASARYVTVFFTGNYDTQYDYYRPYEIQILGN